MAEVVLVDAVLTIVVLVISPVPLIGIVSGLDLVFIPLVVVVVSSAGPIDWSFLARFDVVTVSATG